MQGQVTGATVPKFLGTLTVFYEKKNPRRSKRCHFTNVCLFFFPPRLWSVQDWILERKLVSNNPKMSQAEARHERVSSRAIKAQKLSPFKKLETYLARTRLVRPVIQIPKDSKMVVHGNKDWLKLNWPWNVPNQSVRIKRRCRIYLQLFSYSRFFLLIWQY